MFSFTVRFISSLQWTQISHCLLVKDVLIVGTCNVSGVLQATTGRATGNTFMIFLMAMKCHWLCGVSFIESVVFSYCQHSLCHRDLHTASQGLKTNGFFVYILPMAVVKQTKQQVSSYILV